MNKPTAEQLHEAAKGLRRSDEGQDALAHVHALLDGPALDSENQQRVLTILLGAWFGLYGTALDVSRPKSVGTIAGGK